jgi:hypothetical protein
MECYNCRPESGPGMTNYSFGLSCSWICLILLLADAIIDDSYTQVHLASATDKPYADSSTRTAFRHLFHTLPRKLYICVT